MKHIELSEIVCILSLDCADGKYGSDFHGYLVHDLGVLADEGDQGRPQYILEGLLDRGGHQEYCPDG